MKFLLLVKSVTLENDNGYDICKLVIKFYQYF